MVNCTIAAQTMITAKPTKSVSFQARVEEYGESTTSETPRPVLIPTLQRLNRLGDRPPGVLNFEEACVLD